MRRTMMMTLLGLMLATWGLPVMTPVLAQVPETLSYQGVLKNADGTPVEDDDYNLTFRIYENDSGGEALWTEATVVSVVDGAFNTVLGATAALGLPFDKPYWLGIQIAEDTELTPRIQLTASPYTLNVADGKVVKSLNDMTDDVTLTAGANVVISPSGNTLTISSTGAGADADWIVDGSDLYPAVSGNVGIGTATPATALHVGSSGNTELRIDSDDITGTISFYGSLNGSQPDGYIVKDNDNENLRLSADGSNDAVTILETNGHVGMGTDEPQSSLHIEDHAMGMTTEALHSEDLIIESYDAILGLFSRSGGAVGSGVSLAEIDMDGGLVDKWSLMRETSNSASGLRFTYGPSADANQNTTFMYLNDSGSVGIGTVNPGAELEVVGQVKITGGSPGAGKVLTSGPDGTATWEGITTEYMISPGSLYPSPYDDLNFGCFGDYAWIDHGDPAGGSGTILIPVQIPVKISGIPQMLQSLTIHYQVSNSDTYIDRTLVQRSENDHTMTSLVVSETNRNSDTWTSYTLDVSTPREITGFLTVVLVLDFAPGGRTVRIGSVILRTVAG